MGADLGLRVLQYPDPKLRAPNEKVSMFDENLKVLSKKMFELMYDGIGAGLAAPQVGINKNLMVCNVKGDPSARESEIVLVNPMIVEASLEQEIDVEACLSFPDISGDVSRHSWIKVRGMFTSNYLSLSLFKCVLNDYRCKHRT